MYFDQKIKYLDYLDGDTRVRGAGFLRLECWGKTCNLILQVSGLFEQTQGNYPVYLRGGEVEECLGELLLQNGNGRLELRDLNCESMGTTLGISAAEIEEIQIPLEGSRRLVAILRKKDQVDGGQQPDADAVRAAQVQESNEVTYWKGHEEEQSELSSAGTGKEQSELSSVGTGKEQSELSSVGAGKERNELSSAGAGKEQNELSSAEAEGLQREPGSVGAGKEQSELRGAEAEGEKSDEKKNAWQTGKPHREVKDSEASFTRQANLKPGKWEQLLAIYPSITPFGDARRYLQISPGDFVILKDRSYRMVNNSFLLHGYFTYRHLILHRHDRRGEMAYYVGVPGRYYDREKEVAILFGFESFEGGDEPAKEGDFGYYMMRVEL